MDTVGNIIRIVGDLVRTLQLLHRFQNRRNTEYSGWISALEYQERISEAKCTTEPMYLARKNLRMDNSAKTRRIEEFVKELQVLNKTMAEYHRVVLLVQSDNNESMKMMLLKADEVAMLGDKKADTLPRRTLGVIEIRRRRRWHQLSNAALSLGLILAGIPITLYRPSRYEKDRKEVRIPNVSNSHPTFSVYITH